MRALAAGVIVGLAALGPALAEPRAEIVPLSFPVEEMRGPGSYLAQILPSTGLLPAGARPDGPVAVVWNEGAGAALVGRAGRIEAIPLARAPVALGESPSDGIPHSRQQSAGTIKVHLAEARRDYAHGVLGDAVEAGTLVITERRPAVAGTGPVSRVPTQVTRIRSGEDAVFEDLEPRLADLDGDGVPEILVVKSYKASGAALAVVARRDGAWSIVAETPPIGQPHRWLAPAAVGDVDGDGRPEIVIVRAPHLTGTLQVWSYNGKTLSLRAEAAGYSNHASGSTALDNAALVDWDGRGAPELAIPTLDRTALAILSLDGEIRERARVPLPSPAARGVAALGGGRDAGVVVGLADGRVAFVRP